MIVLQCGGKNLDVLGAAERFFRLRILELASIGHELCTKRSIPQFRPIFKRLGEPIILKFLANFQVITFSAYCRK